MSEACLLCDWAEADRHFQRVQVWDDELWRVTSSLVAPVAGFSYLEPKRHIPTVFPATSRYRNRETGIEHVTTCTGPSSRRPCAGLRNLL